MDDAMLMIILSAHGNDATVREVTTDGRRNTVWDALDGLVERGDLKVRVYGEYDGGDEGTGRFAMVRVTAEGRARNAVRVARALTTRSMERSSRMNPVVRATMMDEDDALPDWGGGQMGVDRDTAARERERVMLAQAVVEATVERSSQYHRVSWS